MDNSIELFSAKFLGSQEAWAWICAVSNGRQATPPALNDEQTRYAHQCGYLPTRTP